MDNLLLVLCCLAVCVIVLSIGMLINAYRIITNKKLFNAQLDAVALYVDNIVTVLYKDSAEKILDHIGRMHHHQPVDAQTGKVIAKVKG